MRMIVVWSDSHHAYPRYAQFTRVAFSQLSEIIIAISLQLKRAETQKIKVPSLMTNVKRILR